MASTLGGFLAGFGLCLLLVGAALALVAGDVKVSREEVERLYNLTHSQPYVSSMNALATLGNYTDKLASVLGQLGLTSLSNALGGVGEAAARMREVYYASERAYNAMPYVENLPVLAAGTILLGLALIVAGLLKIRGSRRRPA
ncbi:hypothetical protein WLZ34_06645 [Thermogladius sp. KZ2Tp1]|uniref:hypothetical protein n=1 Tax=Thermogladius sp. KZ2Tp1 TaxID=3136289 RepID=UPI003DA8DF9A